MLVLLSLSNVSTVLCILGSLQVGAILIALCSLLLPTALVASEPRLRMLKWILPEHAGFWSFRHVILTKIVDGVYPKSVSEYSGARGSTQHQLLSSATCVVGTLQITVACVLWVADQADAARLVVLVIAGVCCILMGQMESALPWKNVVNELPLVQAVLVEQAQQPQQQQQQQGDGRGQQQQQQHGEGIDSPTEPVQPEEANTQGEPAAADAAPASTSTDEARMDAGTRQSSLRYPEPPLGLFYADSAFEESAVHQGEVQWTLGDRATPEREALLKDFLRAKDRRRARIASIGSDAFIRRLVPQYSRIVPVRPTRLDGQALLAAMHTPDEWRIFVEERQSPPPQSHWSPCQADTIAVQVTGPESHGEAGDEAFVSDDSVMKQKVARVHMLTALLFVFLNFVAEGIMGTAAAGQFKPNSEGSYRYLSASFAFLGFAFFLLFTVMSWLSGGYDDLIGDGGRGPLSCLMAREVLPCTVLYQQWPGRSGVQVGTVQLDSAGEHLVVRPRWACAFASCPSFCLACCRSAHYAVADEDYAPNWYDSFHARVGDDIDECICRDWGGCCCCRLLSWLGVLCCLRALTCCVGKKTGAALLGYAFIAVEIVAFGLLALSVAVEAVSAPFGV